MGRTYVCRRCRSEHSTQTTTGPLPSVCATCDPKAERRRERQKQSPAYEWAREERTVRAEQRRLERAMRRGAEKHASNARAKAALRRWAPLLCEPEVMRYGDALRTVATAAAAAPNDQLELKRAIVHVAHAQGAVGRRDALLALAAVAIAMAETLPKTDPDDRDLTYTRVSRACKVA